MGEICDIVGAILYLEAAGFSKIGHWRMGRRRGEE
jgi:hypothetical protein